MIMRLFIALLSALIMQTAVAAKPRVFVCQIVEHPALDITYRGIRDELKKRGFDPDTQLEWAYETAQGSPTLAAQIAQKFVGDKPTVVVGIGTSAAQALASATRQNPIPVVFSSVTDPVQAKLVKSLKKPGGNVTGVSNYVDVKPQFELFQELIPQLRQIGLIYNPGEINSISLVQHAQQAAQVLNLELILATASKSSEVPAAAEFLISKGADAIYINNDNTALAAFEAIVKIASKSKVPVFSSDTDMIAKGALAALGPNQYDVGRQTGEVIAEILNGAQPEQIPVSFPKTVQLRLNDAMAGQLHITIPEPLKWQALQ